LKNEDWSEISPSQLAEVFRSTYRYGLHVFLDPAAGNPAACAFRTRGGGQGILQMLAVTNNHGVELRYKLLQVR